MTEMTNGERMIWAATYASALTGGEHKGNPWAASRVATEAVMEARALLALGNRIEARTLDALRAMDVRSGMRRERVTNIPPSRLTKR